MTHTKPSAARRFSVVCLAAGFLAAGLGAVESLSQRRQRFEAMPAERQEELFRCEQTFRGLPAQERQRIQDLHDQIENARDRDKLLATMHRYYKWFETQPTLRREKLHDKKGAPAARVALVKDYLDKQKLNPIKDIKLDEKSRRALATWMDHFTADHAAHVLELMPPGSHPGIAKLPPNRQQAVLREMILRRWQSAGPNGQIPISEAEMDRLRAGLSPELRVKLEAKKLPDQIRIIAEWLRESPSHELDEQLADFFENSIDEVERDRLMSLPGDEMYKSLTEQFLAHVRSTEPPRRNDPAHRNDHPPWPRGRRPNSPPGSGDHRLPRENGEMDPAKS